MAAKGNAYAAKTVLFPTRFIFLEKTGLVAGNDISYKDYVDHYQGADADLVVLAYDWRFKAEPCASRELEQALRRGLVPLYRRFIDIYMERMAFHGEHDLAEKLADWKRCLRTNVGSMR